MKNIKKHKKTIIITLIVLVIGIIFGYSSAYFLLKLSGTKKYIITSSSLQIYLDESKTLEETVQVSNQIPVSDTKGKQNEGYYFSIVNEENFAVQYSLYLDEEDDSTMPTYALRYNLVQDEENVDVTGNIEDLGETGNRVLHTATVNAKSTHNYTLKMWIGQQAGNDAKNKTYSARIRVEVTQSADYQDTVLNGTDPVLTDNLIPVIISDNGTVTKADTTKEWYNYTDLEWANAVVLRDNKVSYNPGDIILEENIESYFVWIPRYRYKIFNDGHYTGLTTIESKEQTIEIEFENKQTEVSYGSRAGDWLTHPAFHAFDSNGFWVGKFESGYNGATTTEEAQINSTETDKLIIKPNVYSWRNITVGNAFKVSYDYMRNEDSHMMKNTEWGAVAYLQHSKYGSSKSVRVNNNSGYITGYAATVEPTLGYSTSSISGNQYGTTSSVTSAYNTNTGVLASTTNNISGVYDMSGGAWEYVTGYTTATSSVGESSGMTSIYEDFFTSKTFEKYYDKYTENFSAGYTNRILGDATGELGPFAIVTDPNGSSRQRSSWYGDYGYFVAGIAPWFTRGGHWSYGVDSGVFAFSHGAGGVGTNASFRIVLTP